MWSCPTCGKSYAKHGSFLSHLRAHRNFERYPCHSCTYVCDTRTNLTKHENEHHEGAKKGSLCCKHCKQAWYPDERTITRFHKPRCPIQLVDGQQRVRKGWSRNSETGLYERSSIEPASGPGGASDASTSSANAQVYASATSDNPNSSTLQQSSANLSHHSNLSESPHIITDEVRTCPHCGKAVKKTRFNEHVKAHKNAGKSLCKSCALNFATVTNRNKHTKNHHAGTWDGCEECSRCKQAWWMRRHYNSCPVVLNADGSPFIRDGWTKNLASGYYERSSDSASSPGEATHSESAPLPLAAQSPTLDDHALLHSRDYSSIQNGVSGLSQFIYWHPSLETPASASHEHSLLSPLPASWTTLAPDNQPLSTRPRSQLDRRNHRNRAKVLQERRNRHYSHVQMAQSPQSGESLHQTQPRQPFHHDSPIQSGLQDSDLLAFNDHTHLPLSANPPHFLDCESPYEAIRRDSIFEDHNLSNLSNQFFPSQFDSQRLQTTPPSISYPDPSQFVNSGPYYQAISNNTFGSGDPRFSTPVHPTTPSIDVNDSNYFTLAYPHVVDSHSQRSISKPSSIAFSRRQAVLYPDLHLS
ncbi:hypothetical protein JCM3765_001087 [Sporobolomyces pararoseus]